jgi:putative addiction module component (TIGR02574 family)
LREVLKMIPEDWTEPADEAWNSAVDAPESLPLTDSQREELDRRMKARRDNPAAADPWELVKSRILRRK